MSQLITIHEAQTFLQVPLTDTDALLDFLITTCSSVIETFIGYPIAAADITEWYSGNEQEELALRRIPVNSVAELRVDPIGGYGQRVGSFGDDTIWTAGEMYALRKDSGGVSKSGILLCTRNLNFASGLSRLSNPYFGRNLTGLRRLGVWPFGQGNIQVTYNAGYNATPDDIKQACCMMVAWTKNVGPLGGVQLTQESLGEYAKTLGVLSEALTSALSTVGPLGGARQILSRYRDMAWGTR